MNIVIAGYSLGGYGGMETVCKTLHRLMAAEGKHQLHFLFFNEQGVVDTRWHAQLNATTVASQVKNTKLRRLVFAWRMTKFLRQNPADLVICLDTLSCYIATVARQWSRGRYPVVSWLHFSVFDLYKYRYILRADAHLVISRGIQQQVAGLGVDDERIYTVFNPVTPAPALIPSPQHGGQFVFVGRVIFEGQKRVKDLLDALAAVQGEWTLHVVGHGDDLARCQQYAAQAGIADRVIWHGWQAQPWQYIREQVGPLSALVLTSAFEGLPMTLLEAMSHGVYCVSANCPTGPADVIDGRNGQLYEPGCLSDLSAILQRLVENQVAIDPQSITASVTKFHDENYYTGMMAALEAILARYHQ